MKKLILVILTFVFFVLAKPALAESEFTISDQVTYAVSENGVTTVRHNLQLVNNFSQFYATSYSLTLEGIEPENAVAYQSEKELPVNLAKEGGKTTLKVSFPDALVGKGKTRDFAISFQDKSIATKTGEVWEIAVPKLADQDSFSAYTISLIIPHAFGQLAYLSPDPNQKDNLGNKYLYTFNKEAVGETGVTAAFGQFQVFSFDLTYHLENPLNKYGLIEIALPPDTSFQKVNYQKIAPEPENVKVDGDGNWLALYKLTPRQRLDVKTQGVVQIFAEPRSQPRPSPEVLQKK